MTLTIDFSAKGDDPAAGAVVEYRIAITNNDKSKASNTVIWTTLPAEMSFMGAPAGSTILPSQNGQMIIWTMPPGSELLPGEKYTFYYSVRINYLNPSGIIQSTVSTDYNDAYFTAPERHNPLTSDYCFYPGGQIVLFPNPYSLAGKPLKIENYVAGSMIMIYTLAGENVVAARPPGVRFVWDGKNRMGSKVSPGIYYYLIINRYSNQSTQGKFFIIR